MKTNQIFNFKRFGRYAASTLIMRRRQLLLMSGAAITSIFIFSLINLLGTNHWQENRWLGIVIPLTIICGLLYAGSAFPSFRNREKTMSYLMIPASNFEKFIYEFLERAIAFVILFPLLLTIFANLATDIAIQIKQYQHVGFDIKHLALISLLKGNHNEQWIILSGMFAGLTLSIAGTLTFKKYPLIKMMVFCLGVFLAIFGYIYLIFEKFHLRHPWITELEHHVDEQQIWKIFTIILIAFSLIILSYSFFKLKEKEVS